MINPNQLFEYIVQPTLKEIDMYSKSAAALVMGTCAQESDMGTYIKQLNGGPAIGIYQMEPATFSDVMDYITRKGKIKIFHNSSEQLLYDLKFATTMCRVFYWRFEERLPEHNDVEGLARYWKKYYNTHLGAGEEHEFSENFVRYGLHKINY